jgi:outer membrane receptor for ferrienterochelin and colicins
MPRASAVEATIVLGLVIATTTLSARAQDLEDEAEAMGEVDLLQLLNVEVSTATKTVESLDDAPAIITVVTAEDIARWGYQSVGEALQHVLGFYLLDDHILPNAGVRGVTGGLAAESGVIKVMIDGASVAYRATSGNWLGVELIPLGAVKQIEIIRGPASALYGADAFLGVVNIITLSPEDLPVVDARGHMGTIGAHPGGQFDVTSGGRWGNFDLMVAAAGEAKDRSGLTIPEQSPTTTVPAYNQAGNHAANLQRRSIVATVRAGYRVPKTADVILTAVASAIEREGDFAHWAQLTGGVDGAGRDVGTVINLGQARVTGNGRLYLTDHFHLALMGTYFQGQVLGNDRIEVASDQFWVKRRGGYRGMDANLEARLIPSDDINLILGVETLVDNEDKPASQRISKDTGENIEASIEQESVTLTNLGAYLSSNYKLLDPWLKLTGGVRVDRHSIYGSQITGRLGATSRWSRAIVMKILYGSSFKAPSPYLLYAEPLGPGDVIGNEDLKPQSIDTYELQVAYKPSLLFHISSGIAYSIVRDKAEFAPRGINQSAQNIANQRSLSWETRVDSNYDVVQGYFSFERVFATRNLGREGYVAELIGSRNVVYPPWIARAGVSVDLPLHHELPVQLSFQGIHVASRAASNASILESGQRFDLPSYLWLNASLVAPRIFFVPGHETTIALRAKNLLDVRGPDPGFFGFELPLTAREVMIELRHVY